MQFSIWQEVKMFFSSLFLSALIAFSLSIAFPSYVTFTELFRFCFGLLTIYFVRRWLAGPLAELEEFVKFGLRVVAAIAIFYALWFIWGQASGIYPVDVYRNPLGPWDALWPRTGDPKQVPAVLLLGWMSLLGSGWIAFKVIRGKTGLIKLIGITAFVIAFMAVKFPLITGVLIPPATTVDKNVSERLKATPTPTPGVAGSPIAIDNIASWPMCKDAKAGAKDARDIDLSGITGPTDQMKDTNYHDCWYRVIRGTRPGDVVPQVNERYCFRYAFRISDRRGQVYCSVGPGKFPPGEMDGPFLEFVALDSRSVRVMTW